MGKIQHPPKKDLSTDVVHETKKSVSEKKIHEFITKGGSSPEPGRDDRAEADDKLRNFAIKIQDSLLGKVKKACQLRPQKSAWRKTRISMQDWFIEAIEEKLKRELK
jgi:hypothetical protein